MLSNYVIACNEHKTAKKKENFWDPDMNSGLEDHRIPFHIYETIVELDMTVVNTTAPMIAN